MADQGEPIVLDDSDDEVQCLGESPLPKTRTLFHGTPPPTSRTFPHIRNISQSSNKVGHTRNISHSFNNAGTGSFHNRSTSRSSNCNTDVVPPPSPTGSVKSSTSSSSNSSKKRKTKQVNDGRELNGSDWSFQDGIRTPDNRSRESTMSLANAPSPRSTGSNSPNSPTRQPATPARSYILIDSSSGPSNGTGNTTMTPANTGDTPAKAPYFGTTHSDAAIPFSFNKATASDSFSLPLRAGSNVSNSSRASSALSEPPAESRGVSFATFQNNLRFGSGGDGSNASSSSGSSSGNSTPPQSPCVSFAAFQASLASGSPVSPPRLGRLTLEDTQIRHQINNLDAEQNLIDLCDDSDDDEEDDDLQITGVTNNGWGRDDTPLGIPYAFRMQSRTQSRSPSVEAAEVQQRVQQKGKGRESQSPTPPKRKRSEAFSKDEDESSDGSRYTPEASPSPSSASRARTPRVGAILEEERVATELVNRRYSPARSSRGSHRSRSGSPRIIPDQEPVVIHIEDDENGEEVEVFVDEFDDLELPEDDTGDELPETAVGLGRQATPISISDQDDEDVIHTDDEIECTGSKALVPTPKPSVALPSRRKSSIIPRRNPEIVYPLEELNSITTRQGWELKKGTFLEVLDLDGTDTAYLLIIHITRHAHTNEVKLRGHRFERARRVFGMLNRTRNEMCRMLEVDEDDVRAWHEQGMIEVELERCIYKPRAINITNRRYGAYGTCTFRRTARGNQGRGMTKHQIEEKCLFACRWECIRSWPTAKNRVNQNLRGARPKILKMLKANDPWIMGRNVRQDDSLIRDEWRGRGATVLGGSYIPGGDPLPQGFFQLEDGEVHKVHVNFNSVLRNEEFNRIQSTFNMDLTVDDEDVDEVIPRNRNFSAHLTQTMTIDLTDPTPLPPSGSIRSSVSSNASSTKARLSMVSNHLGTLKRAPGQKYTYGDAFCGAGGATRGAHMAGLKILYGFDMDTHACSSWHRNFPNAAIYCMSAQSICSHKTIDFRCDILHMSPPCQYFSPAHTVAGKGDEANIAALFAVEEILKTVKPRLATLEQTFGITNPQFTYYFQRLVNMFTTSEYSVTYKVCQMANFGLPQRRVRLIIIAAAPGEILPPIPTYTHAEHPNPHPVLSGTQLKPWQGVAPLIENIPRHAPDHDLVNSELKVARAPWDGESICPRAMTCAGGQNYHYGGRRMFTNREFAAIQGFPMEHVFGSRNVKRQIGNAVPPTVAKVLFEACRRALEEADGVEKEVIALDD